ncbi:MAG: XrtA system polysaccharide chain length determinant [Lysobacterales bacterium]
MDPQVERLAQSLLRELLSHRFTWLMTALVIGCIAVVAGLTLPKKYSAYGSILIENRNIVGPLMEGVAEQTQVEASSAAVVRELAFSKRSMEEILRKGRWLEDEPTPAEQQFLMDRIISRTRIEEQGGSLIGISYNDDDPNRAYVVTKSFVDWVIEESRESKRRESVRAFEFIQNQADIYREKLLESEEGLKEFRSSNFDALPESAADATGRVNQLRRDIEALQVEIRELEARRRSLRMQLSGEAAVTSAMGQNADRRVRLAALEQELATLRMSYHDSYPDIVRLNGQIDQLKAQLQNAPGDVVSNQSRGDNEGRSSSINPLYGELRSQLAAAETDKVTMEARLLELRELLGKEVGRTQRIASAEASLLELTRDYDVNRSIYQDLQRRRENARVSMNLDQEDQGVIMKIQEPPAVPQAPSGLRFIHIIALAILASIAVPIAVSAALVQFDPRLRMKEQIEELQVPVLGVISEMQMPSKRRALSHAVFGLGILILASIYAGAAALKLSGWVP